MGIISECIGVSKTYDGQNDVLRDVTLRVFEGDFVSILGESGSGKSTLLGILGGMDAPSRGKVLFDGEDLSTRSQKELALLRRTKLGFVFQFFNLAPYLTAKENILLPIMLAGKPIRSYEKEVSELAERLKIADSLMKMPSQLSGGEQQRVAIARGLIYHPKMILLDEPTGNLDTGNSEEIMQLLKGINVDLATTVVQVTHSESNARYGNRIVRIRDGAVEEESIPDETAENESHDLPEEEGSGETTEDTDKDE